jgi:hypothetical protein
MRLKIKYITTILISFFRSEKFKKENLHKATPFSGEFFIQCPVPFMSIPR